MTGTAAADRIGAKRLVFILAALLAFAVLLSLGAWQVYRLQWKEALLQSIQLRTASPSKPLAELELLHARSGEIDYWPVTATGRFEHINERHFFATHKGASGFYIYTPLRLADSRILFVNRGFVPYDRKDPVARAEGQVQGEVTVTGLARDRLTSKPSWVVPDNDPNENIYYWKDLESMARAGGYRLDGVVVPFFVDADAAPNPGGLPVGGVTIVDLPNNHLQYAITWFGLAAALAGVFAFWLMRQRSG